MKNGACSFCYTIVVYASLFTIPVIAAAILSAVAGLVLVVAAVTFIFVIAVVSASGRWLMNLRWQSKP